MLFSAVLCFVDVCLSYVCVAQLSVSVTLRVGCEGLQMPVVYVTSHTQFSVLPPPVESAQNCVSTGGIQYMLGLCAQQGPTHSQDCCRSQVERHSG